LRGTPRIPGAGGRQVHDRGRALILAVVVLLAVALVTGAVVLAKTINGTSSYDVINGTAGNDVIQARDDGPDTIDCGAGVDTVYVDRSEDGVYNCETVIAP
jgi:RTX calcium-binding nonapeptide repeat (4 copies)